MTGKTFWLTGLPCSGKTTIGKRLVERIEKDHGLKAVYLDGDVVRSTINSDLGFSEVDRKENIRRTIEITRLLNGLGITVVAGFISPYRSMRKKAREAIGDGFFEIFINAPIEVCEKRDVKGMYKEARSGKRLGFTGVTAPYEEPEMPELVVDTGVQSIDESVLAIMSLIEKN
ncbi:MAG TPA: adenylyl-sulfate kinase [Candidatus Kaiserbacteria bacterium]|nr:adenylyl-sulfate kinase [Candidatus Kaiserbacteria bacterium]